VTDEQLRFITDAAAGDARTAIGILRNAAKNAKKPGVDKITKNLIREAVPETRSEIRQTDLDRLTRDQRCLYELIEEASEISPGELYEEYSVEVNNPKCEQTVRNYLQKWNITSSFEHRDKPETDCILLARPDPIPDCSGYL